MTFTRRSLLKAAAASPAMLVLTGCPGSGLITALDVAEVAATSAIPVITAFSPQLGPVFTGQAIAYANGIANACVQSIDEIGSSDPKATQYTKIIGYFAAVAALSLPPGTVSEVLAVIAAVGAAVQIILSQVHGTPAPASLSSSQNAAAKTLLRKYQDQVKALGSDKARIADILTRARGVQ